MQVKANMQIAFEKRAMTIGKYYLNQDVIKFRFSRLSLFPAKAREKLPQLGA